MTPFHSPLFTPIPLNGVYNRNIGQLTGLDCSEEAAKRKEHFLTGEQSLWGIPFLLGQDESAPNVVLLRDSTVKLSLPRPSHHPNFVFLHAADHKPAEKREDGLLARPVMGEPRLGETVCEYILEYSDGTNHNVGIRRRFQINEFVIRWGENSFECVPHIMPASIRTNSDDIRRGKSPPNKWDTWGETQTRVTGPGGGPLVHWLYTLENPFPEKELLSFSFVPRDGTVFLFAISAGSVTSNPLRWESRQKARLRLPDDYVYEPNEFRDFDDLRIDMGQIISVQPAKQYDHEQWASGYNNQEPVMLEREFIVDYTAHPDACFYVGEPGSERRNAVRDLFNEGNCLIPIKEESVPVLLKVVDKNTGSPVPVKIHVHGEHGEYLVPVNHHRIPNPYWFEDYGTDFYRGNHLCTYINGAAEYRFPQGTIYIEIAKGFEIRPVRRSYAIEPDTTELTIEIERVLHWRDRGWVTADTHVHFLSPQTALLEGAAEGVNVINLLAAQWGEMFSNIGDFDGKTTIGSKEDGGSGEYLVRVGTENRQQVLGHISLLGYEGHMINPLSSGGPNESALGDPVGVTLTEWAMKCRAQNGIAIMPHIPNPRAEGAAALVLEQIDGMEMCSYIDQGINPYSLSDWYRYLNCGYHVPAVGGTDKMSAFFAVGMIRTYSLISEGPFTYESWMESVRKGITFVTFGPLIDFNVEGKPAGSKIQMKAGGGTVNVAWEAASVTIPVTQVEIIVNGEIREVVKVNPVDGQYAGNVTLKIKGSSWIALRVRGQYPDKKEIVAAHTSTVMILVAEENCFNAADALTILDQIEGSAAYLRTIGTKAEHQAYQRMLLLLTSAHRQLHNRMHRHGAYHHHSVLDDHHHHD